MALARGEILLYIRSAGYYIGGAVKDGKGTTGTAYCPATGGAKGFLPFDRLH